MDAWSQFPDAPDPRKPDRWADFPDADPTTAATAPTVATAPENVLDDRGVPGGRISWAPVDTMGEKAIRTSAGVLGAPVDATNSLLKLIGVPTSDDPMFGSKSVEAMMHSASGNRESREIATDAPNVAQDGGAPLSERVYSSFLNTRAPAKAT